MRPLMLGSVRAVRECFGAVDKLASVGAGVNVQNVYQGNKSNSRPILPFARVRALVNLQILQSRERLWTSVELH